ncbi:hypothetical protein KR009_008194, partial [Drosophila setifemur]
LEFFCILITLIYLLKLSLAICGLPHSQSEENIACVAYIPSYSYDSYRNRCVKFIYGGCKGNDNRFLTQKDCEVQCLE